MGWHNIDDELALAASFKAAFAHMQVLWSTEPPYGWEGAKSRGSWRSLVSLNDSFRETTPEVYQVV